MNHFYVAFCIFRTFAAVVLVLNLSGTSQAQGIPVTPADKPDLLSYGSRAGMEVTIRNKAGLDTDQATVRAELTADNARSYCQSYAQDDSNDCRERYLKDTRLESTITANCQTGAFTTFYGKKFQFFGYGDRPFVLNVETDQFLDDSSAAGLNYTFAQFAAMCPRRADPKGEAVLPRVWANPVGVVPGAILCNDFATVSQAFHMYASSWEERMQDHFTRGLSKTLRGEALVFEPEMLGCVLLKSGTPMFLLKRNPVPMVIATLENDVTVLAVTMNPMIRDERPRSRER